MTTRRLLALAHKGVARAECRADGQWAVEQVLTGQDVRCLEVDPLNPEVVYAGTQGQGVFRSEDGGRNWRPAGLQGVIVKSLAASRHQLLFHPHASHWAYQAHGGGPAVSRDAGQTWTQPRAGLDRRYCINVAADPERPEIWYAVVAPILKAHSANSQAVVVRSTGGAAWKKLGGGLPDSFDRLPLLASDPVAPGQLYLASGHGEVWHSADCGDTWQRLFLDLGDIWFSLIVS